MGVDPYVALLDGGAEGDAYKEIQDLFIFSQIRSQGEDTMSPRICGDRMPLSEVPNFMRAIGFYPTEYEVCGVGGGMENVVSECHGVCVGGRGGCSVCFFFRCLCVARARHHVPAAVGAWDGHVTVIAALGPLQTTAAANPCGRGAVL